MPIVTTYPARAASTASRTDRSNASRPVMTWSAANDPTTTSPCRSSRTAAASPIAAMESRGDGSASTFSAGRPGSCVRAAATCRSPVTRTTPCSPASGTSRSTVAWSSDRPEPVRSRRNLGDPARESGHSRVPAPPAGTTAWKPGIGDAAAADGGRGEEAMGASIVSRTVPPRAVGSVTNAPRRAVPPLSAVRIMTPMSLWWKPRDRCRRRSRGPD